MPTVYRVRKYDIVSDEFLTSSRMFTQRGAAIVGSEIIRDTAMEIDAAQLEAGEEWTPKNFQP